MANNPDGKFETYHEVPGSKYFFISGPTGIAVHKGFFKYWSFFLIAATMISTLIAVYTDWWPLLIVGLLTFFYVQHWYVGFPATFIIIGIGWFWYNRRQKRIKRERKLRAQAQRDARALKALHEVEGR